MLRSGNNDGTGDTITVVDWSAQALICFFSISLVALLHARIAVYDESCSKQVVPCVNATTLLEKQFSGSLTCHKPPPQACSVRFGLCVLQTWNMLTT